MNTPLDMAAVCRDIDLIDGELIRLLAQRQNLVELAVQNNLDPDVAEVVWRAMIEAFITLELRVYGE